MDSSTHVSKKQRRECAWSITFEDPSSLKFIVDVVQACMCRINFKVSKIGGVFYLSVDGADSAFTSCVSARLQIDRININTADEEFSFCLECKHILTAIDVGATNSSLEIEGYPDQAMVSLKVKNPDICSHEDTSELATFVDHEQTFELNNMDFKMFVELDVYKLREIIKKARKSRAEVLRLQIFVKEFGGSKQRSMVILSVKGDSQTHTQKFCHEVSKDEDGSMVVRAAADDCAGGVMSMDQWTEELCVYNQVFPIDKIDAFVKSLNCRHIVAKVKKQLPLLFTHSLGGANDDTQHIRFLVAFVNEED